MLPYKIRNATLDDAQAILDIYAPFITDTTVSFEIEVPTLEQFRDRMAGIMENYPYLVCEIDGKVEGYAYLSRYAERAAYRYSVDVSVYISPDCHRMGIGRALYERIFELALEKGFYTVFAGITGQNEKSINFHKAMGFEEAGYYHNVGYKFGKWIDLMWLEKPLREYDTPTN